MTLGDVCPCGHDEAAHAEVDPRPCFASDLAGRICPCAEWRPRRSASTWVALVNRVLGGRGRHA